MIRRIGRWLRQAFCSHPSVETEDWAFMADERLVWARKSWRCLSCGLERP